MIIIIDGKTRFLAVAGRGQLAAFKKGIAAFEQYARQQKGMKAKIQPLAEGAACVTLRFKGSTDAYDDAMGRLDELRARVTIDTVPLPESVAIGTWPVPEKKAPGLAWVIRVGGRPQKNLKPSRLR